MNNRHALVGNIFPFLYTCCFLLLLAGCASPPSTGEGGAALAADRECRTERTTGSKMKRSVCMSAGEWAIADARNQEKEDLQNEYFRRMRESSAQGAGPQFDTPTP